MKYPPHRFPADSVLEVEIAGQVGYRLLERAGGPLDVASYFRGKSSPLTGIDRHWYIAPDA